LGAKNPVIKQNDFPDLENNKIIISEPNETNKPIDPGSIIIKKVIDDVPIPWNSLEKVPIYPGCESAKTNDKRKKCMSEKITQLIQKKFNTDIASKLGLMGIQKINVQFKIDKTGNITDIKTRAPFSQLEDEALRVVEKIPTMKPGLQRGQPVSVLYNLPIVFKVQ
jgi:protein TonB